MRSRKYTKIVEFWQVTDTPDGYGGDLVSEEKIAKSWCNVKTPKNTQRLTDIGITDVKDAIVIQLRHRNDISYNSINQFIKYNGVKYIIRSVINVDLNDVDIEIIATREQTKDIEVISPINV